MQTKKHGPFPRGNLYIRNPFFITPFPLMQQQAAPNRDYSSISPSAKMLLLLKGHTTLPFVRKTAELVILPEKYDAGNPPDDIITKVRMLHFEERYKTIDSLLEAGDVKNSTLCIFTVNIKL